MTPEKSSGPTITVERLDELAGWLAADRLGPTALIVAAIKLALAVGYLVVRGRLQAERAILDRQRYEIAGRERAKAVADQDAEPINS